MRAGEGARDDVREGAGERGQTLVKRVGSAARLARALAAGLEPGEQAVLVDLRARGVCASAWLMVGGRWGEGRGAGKRTAGSGTSRLANDG